MRIRKRSTAQTWSDSFVGRTGATADGRYIQIPEIDRWRSLAFDLPPAPDRGTVMQRVRQLIEALHGALDEGTGPALDLLIESWVASWIATVNTEYVDHTAVIDVHYGQAAQWLTETEEQLTFERNQLERLQEIYDRAWADLAGAEPRTSQGPVTE
jgi:hypothetical protein